MKTLLTKSVIKTGLIAGVLLLAGCVYEPYGYVRSDGYNGDAYYGTTYSDDGYYAPGYGYYDGYYDPYWGWGPALGLGFYYGGGRRGYYHGHGYWGHGGYNHGGWSHGVGGYHGGSDGHASHGTGHSTPHGH